MIVPRRDKIVLLGMIGRMPVAGAVWQAVHYLVGLERLGYEAYYVEAHGCMSWAFPEDELGAAQFIHRVMQRFDLGHRWAFHARTGSGSYYGMSEQQVNRLYQSAAAIFNLHGGTVPSPQQSATGRLVYLDTDPVNVQIELHHSQPFTINFLEQHCAFFTFAENYGRDDCGLPISQHFRFKPTRQPVVLDFWHGSGKQGERFTTVGNWQQLRRVVEYNGEEYSWSKHLEFLKFLELPGRTTQEFELALSSCDEEAKELLRKNGWMVRDAFSFSRDLDNYRQYIAESRGEFTVAKDQNIRLRTGWFSDRAATYLASERPVITQETGFSNIIPTGQGLFGFSSVEEILAAVDAVNSDYGRHSRAAASIAREYFSHDVVLKEMLSELGLGTRYSQSAPILRPRVHIAGSFGSSSGIGTATTRYEKALRYAGIETSVIDVSQPCASARIADGEQKRINLICCDIGSYFNVRSGLGEEFFRNSYNIGLWPWELPAFPSSWHDRFAYLDEIWAPSSFISSTLSPISPVPVVRIPHVLEPEVLGSREDGRRRLGLTNADFAFAFIFNCYSSYARKNPLAVIDSFNRTFRAEEPVHLIIKCANPEYDSDQLNEMKARAAGRRISIHQGHWSAQEIADLTAACDCYVSLHRAEGVGLTIADAMAVGKPVVATGWSGNMDFMNVSNSFPVRWHLVEIDRRVAHYPKGGAWAEPSLEHASELMRYVVQHREEAAQRGKLARQEIASHYSVAAIGSLMARRLGLISGMNRFQEMKRRLESPIGDVTGFLNEFRDLGEYLPSGHLRYTKLKSDLRSVVREQIPRDAALAIVSKGDEDLLGVHDGPSWHFPCDANFSYAGFHPENTAKAICSIDALIAQGGRFLLFPRTSFWWLEYYAGLGDYLQEQYRLAYSDDLCRIFELSHEEERCEVA